LNGVVRNSCFLSFSLRPKDGDGSEHYVSPYIWNVPYEQSILRLIHVPALRGNPKRAYEYTPVTGPQFQGTFENYTAGIIHHWFITDDKRTSELSRVLGSQGLGLTSGIGTRQIDDTQVELLVNRVIGGNVMRTSDMVNIKDVGFGVSQVLPVLVALLVAEAGQLVYLEQPELHLHPRAQHALAQVLADAANRGVRVVVETHSDLLLLGIQTLVAEGNLPPEKVICHWFERGEDGVSHITPTNLDKDGAFSESDWPEDFGAVSLRAQGRYLDAAELPQAER